MGDRAVPVIPIKTLDCSIINRDNIQQMIPQSSILLCNFYIKHLDHYLNQFTPVKLEEMQSDRSHISDMPVYETVSANCSVKDRTLGTEVTCILKRGTITRFRRPAEW